MENEKEFLLLSCTTVLHMKKVRQRNDNNAFRNNNTELILNYL